MELGFLKKVYFADGIGPNIRVQSLTICKGNYLRFLDLKNNFAIFIKLKVMYPMTFIGGLGWKKIDKLVLQPL